MKKLYRTALVLFLLIISIGFVSAEKISGIAVRGGLSYGMTSTFGLPDDKVAEVDRGEISTSFENFYVHLGPGLRVDYVDGSLISGGRFSCLFSSSNYWNVNQTDEYPFLALKAGGHVAWQSKTWIFGLVMDYVYYHDHPLKSCNTCDLNRRHALFIGGEMGLKLNMTDHLYTFMECSIEYSPISLRSFKGGPYEFEVRHSIHQEAMCGISYIF